MSASPRTHTLSTGRLAPAPDVAWFAHPSARRPGRALRAVAVSLLAAELVFVSIAGAVVALYVTTDLPPIPPPPQTSVLLDRGGREISKLHAGVDRTLISFSDMPEHLRRAVVAAEDADFYRHDGLDPSAIARATWNDLTTGSFSQGGSTITQQFVKNVMTGTERSISRKVREAILAMKLEREWSKDRILEHYLNTVYFGHGAYGVQAAAQTYFGIDASRLSVAQSALLAGLISAPSARDPFLHRAAAKAARSYVLDRMVAVGTLSMSRAEELRHEPLGLVVERHLPSPAPHFLEYVRQRLLATFGEDALYRGGLRVKTTIDLDMQAAADRAVGAWLPGRHDPEAALVAIDPQTGAIRAMVGGRNFDRREFNLATQGLRQAGSAFKTFVVMAALEQGISPLETRYGPSRITIPDPFCETDGQPWVVSNAGDQWGGTMSIEQATAGSVNTIFAQLTTEVGPEAVVDVARRMGIQTKLQPVCSIGLGTSEVTVLDMTSAFATLAAQGVYVPPRAIDRVTSADGAVIQGSPGGIGQLGVQVVSAQDAMATTRVLEGVIDHGTGTAARLADRPAAGKTGTAERSTDAWFCGFVPQLATCVWTGYPRTARPMVDVHGFPSVYGGTIPAQIWHDFMTAATSDMPVVDFAPVSYDVYEDQPAVIAPSPSPSTGRTPAPSLTTVPSPSPSPTGRADPSPTPAPKPKPSPSPSPSPSPEPATAVEDDRSVSPSGP